VCGAGAGVAGGTRRGGLLRLLCRVDERLGVVQQNDVEGCQTLPSLRCVAGELCGICEHYSLLSLV